MERGIIELIGEVGYNGPMVEDGRLAKALDEGVTSVDFTQLVAWLSQELKSFCNLDEHITPVTNADEASHFLLETSSFLKELGCPYSDLVEGPVNERLSTRASRAALLTYLLSELQAARMIEANCPEINAVANSQSVSETPHNDLKNMLLALRFTKPPDNITAGALFAKVEKRISEILPTAHPDLVSKPIFDTPLNIDKWKLLAKEQQSMHNEYQIKRELLLTRLNVTAQSFEWGDRLKDRQDDMARVFRDRTRAMPKEPAVDLADLLAARMDLSVLEKTSNPSVRRNTQSEVNKVVIGKVPDRGGRPSEQNAPPKEMPSWQTNRTADAPRGGGGGRGNYRGGRGGGRGGRGGGGGYQQQDFDKSAQYQGQYRGPSESQQQSYNNRGSSRAQGGYSQQGTDGDRAYNNGGRGRGRGEGRGGGGGEGRGGYGRGRARERY